MKATRVLLLAIALLATAQLPTTSAHGAAARHDHDHQHHGHHDHHDHDHHDHEHHGHDHHGHEKRDHDHEHHGGHRHVKEAHHHDHDDHGHVHDHHHGHAPHHHGDAHGSSSKPTAAPTVDRFSPRVWAEALFATALVGAAPVVVLFFVPLGVGDAEAQKPLLRVFLSFAAGGLLGDALLHLLPHSLPEGGHSHDHGHGHDHGHEDHAHSIQDLAVWLYCIAGMMTFLMLEKFVRAHTGGDGHGHAHGHAHGTAAKQAEHRTGTQTATSGEGLRRRNVASKSSETSDAATKKDDDVDDSSAEPTRIAAAGYLNLAADFSHNFTDGLAIGATFLRGSGWQTTVAMLLHEVPHEIGDFAILIQSGFTRREAMFTQLATALGAMAGTVLGLLIEGAGDSSSAWISPFTAGGFIYIACASVMPELLEDCSLAQSLKEGIAMCLGIGLMIVIALYE